MAKTLKQILEEEEAAKKTLPMLSFKEGDAGSTLTPGLGTASGVAPRTFEVIQREKLRAAGENLLGAQQRAMTSAQRQAGDLALEALRGTPSGTGIRTAAHRRASQELLDQFAKAEVDTAQTAYGITQDIAAAGNIESDRMLKLTTYEKMIQTAWDEGKSMERIAQMLEAWMKLESDPWVRDWLTQRAMDYPGFEPMPS